MTAFLPLVPLSASAPTSLFPSSSNKCSRRLIPRATLAERVTPPATTKMQPEVSVPGAITTAAGESSSPVPVVAEPVVPIDSEEELLAVLAKSADSLVVIRVHARWCRSCRALEPKWRRLARELAPECTFAEMEFEANRILAARLAVKVMPTFLIYDAAEGKVDHFSCGPRRAHILRDHIQHALDNKGRRLRGEEPLEMPEFK